MGGALVVGLVQCTLASAAEPNTVETLGGTLRLISGGVTNGVARLGLAIDLKPGWHTYWRYPGDSGVPPDISTTDSTNVGAVSIDYPAPRRFGDSGDQTIGYEGTTVLVLNAPIVDPSKPATVTVNARLGICRQICVPVDATFAMPIDSSVTPDKADVAALQSVRAALPKPVEPGADLSISSLKRDPTGKPEQVTFTVKGPTSQLTDVFVEGPDGWALPLPSRVGGSATDSTWRFALDGLPAGVKGAGTALTFTMVGKDASTTQSVVLP